MELLKEYGEKYSIPEIINDYGERRKTTENRIIFPNGWAASIVPNLSHKEIDAKYSVAMCDYNGYFDWSRLDKFGAINGCFYCNTELEILMACEVIRRIETCIQDE